MDYAVKQKNYKVVSSVKRKDWGMFFLKLCDFFHKFRSLYIALWLLVISTIFACTYLAVVKDQTETLGVMVICLIMTWPLSKISQLNKSRYK